MADEWVNLPRNVTVTFFSLMQTRVFDRIAQASQSACGRRAPGACNAYAPTLLRYATRARATLKRHVQGFRDDRRGHLVP